MIDIKKEVVFVTTTLYTKWLDYQSNIIKKLFPKSNHIIIDGRDNWPYSWFYWIEEVKKTDYKYFVHIDEDFFITDENEFIKCIEKMDTDNIDLLGCADGYHHYRGANAIAINSFLMFGRVEKLKKINLQGIKFNFSNKGWQNNLNLYYKDEYKKDWIYNFQKFGDSNFYYEQEPYYSFMWSMKETGCKFDYLYPHFDDDLKSTNPRLVENSNDIGIHMWYTRQWSTSMDVWGLPNIERYNKLEKKIKGL
jgi:hypothetical protein